MITEQWKFKVTTGHPEYFVSNVIPTIEELEGRAEETSRALGESQYWVTLPTSVISRQLDVLIEMDRYSTWVIQSRRAFYELEDLSK